MGLVGGRRDVTRRADRPGREDALSEFRVRRETALIGGTPEIALIGGTPEIG
ncbi:hypothetical protein [Nonomuraea guangzhouensis]|uniref:Uncharacterized protein n=1 Tax=Nonomuraea guangzhouensis TaxID=1291555 RepID=A0ABW4GMT7_9ACTN|nr:hypothetical protein [Nonomuraea guangzhouensis]